MGHEVEVGQAEDWLAEDMSGCWSTHRLDEHLEVGPGAGVSQKSGAQRWTGSVSQPEGEQKERGAGSVQHPHCLQQRT